MKRLLALVTILGLTMALGACATVSKVDLASVAKSTSMKNITTGDGTFENYTATGYHKGKEIGIGLGIFMWKFMELYPGKTNEDLLTDVAKDASQKGANAMINVTPACESFYGFIIGLYVDSAKGTGIKTR